MNILSVSSNTTSTQETLHEVIEHDSAQEEFGAEEIDEDQFEEIEEMRLRHIETGSQMQNKEDITIAYIAGTIEKKMSTSRFGCEGCEVVCKNVFRDNRKIVTTFVENVRTQRPCESTYIICKHTHEILKEKMKPASFDYKTTYALISHRLSKGIFFPESDFSHDYEHKMFLVEYIVDEYVRSYGTYVAQCHTLEQQKILIRNRNRKITHFKGQ